MLCRKVRSLEGRNLYISPHLHMLHQRHCHSSAYSPASRRDIPVILEGTTASYWFSHVTRCSNCCARVPSSLVKELVFTIARYELIMTVVAELLDYKARQNYGVGGCVVAWCWCWQDASWREVKAGVASSHRTIALSTTSDCSHIQWHKGSFFLEPGRPKIV